MVTYNIQFTWPDYKKFSGETQANSTENAIRRLLFRGLGNGNNNQQLVLKANEIFEAGAFEDLNDLPKVRKVINKNPLPPMDDSGDVTGSMKACVAAIFEALGGSMTEQEIGSEVGLPVDRELAIPYDQGHAKPSDNDRHNHFYKDVNELQDPFQI